MKVLQINCVYGKGSTGKIISCISRRLKEENIETVICYGRGQKENCDGVYKTCSELYAKFNNLFSRFSGIVYGGCYFSTKKLIKTIEKVEPNIVHLHCINGFFVNIYDLLEWLKKNEYKTVITLHAEFMYTGGCDHALECEKWRDEVGCGYCDRWKSIVNSPVADKSAEMWSKMKAAFDGFGKNLMVVSVSPWLENRAKNSAILKDFKHATVLNGIDCENVFFHRENIGENQRPKVLHVTAGFSTAENHPKGGKYVIELARRMPEVDFYIAGKCISIDKSLENVKHLGEISDQSRLAEEYSASDLTLLTGKRETYSMPLAESLCCGTPVVSFYAGGPESIAMPEYCSFVEYGDVDALENVVKKKLDKKIDKTEISLHAKSKYSDKEMFEQYLEIYKTMME